MQKKKQKTLDESAAAARGADARANGTAPAPTTLAEAAVTPATAAAPTAAPAAAPRPGEDDEEEVDPLDAFMATEVAPEVARRVAEERAAKTASMLARANEIKSARERGVDVKARKDAAMLEDVDEEDVPDEVIEVPDNKVKLVIGAGGENVKKIQKKSNARLQVRRKDDVMNRGFGGVTATEWEDGVFAAEGGRRDGVTKDGTPIPVVPGMTTFMLFGSKDEREHAKKMIRDLFDRAEEEKRQKRRDDKELAKKRKERERQMYHLRHKKDYDVLEVPLGASKEECKRAYRKLAVRWHPDKHADGDAKEVRSIGALFLSFLLRARSVGRSLILDHSFLHVIESNHALTNHHPSSRADGVEKVFGDSAGVQQPHDDGRGGVDRGARGRRRRRRRRRQRRESREGHRGGDQEGEGGGGGRRRRRRRRRFHFRRRRRERARGGGASEESGGESGGGGETSERGGGDEGGARRVRSHGVMASAD